MRRAGKPTVTSRDARRPPTLAALADAEARQRHALRPLAHHPPDPRAARVVRELQSQVDAALKDQAERARAETRVESAMSVIDRRLDALQNAFGALADAVVDELDAVRADHASWRAEKAAWTARMERVEAAAEVRASTVDAWAVERAAQNAALEAVRADAVDAAGSAREARAEATALRAEASALREAVLEAERREETLTARIDALRGVAEGADAKLQEQIDALSQVRRDEAPPEKAARSTPGLQQSSVDAGTPGLQQSAASGGSSGEDAGPRDGRRRRGSVTTRDILLAGAASEADVVALRDWTKAAAEAHDARLRALEKALSLRVRDGGSGGSGRGRGRTPTSEGRREKKVSSSEGECD
jgi:hypothetical protein